MKEKIEFMGSTIIRNRGTGKTTRLLDKAVKLANEGKKVAFLVATRDMKRYVEGLLHDSEHVDKLKGDLKVIVLSEARIRSDRNALVVDHYTWDYAREDDWKSDILDRFYTMIETRGD